MPINWIMIDGSQIFPGNRDSCDVGLWVTNGRGIMRASAVRNVSGPTISEYIDINSDDSAVYGQFFCDTDEIIAWCLAPVFELPEALQEDDSE